MEEISLKRVVTLLYKNHGRATQAFYLYKSLDEKIKSGIYKKIVEIGETFFGGVKAALKTQHIIEIAKFFDSYEGTGSVKTLKEVHEKWMNEINRCYTTEEREIIKKICRLRNQYLAHNDIDPENIELTLEEVEKILPLMRKILDIATNDLEQSSIIYDAESRVEKEASHDVDYIFSILGKGEAIRRRDIEEKYKI